MTELIRRCRRCTRCRYSSHQFNFHYGKPGNQETCNHRGRKCGEDLRPRSLREGGVRGGAVQTYHLPQHWEEDPTPHKTRRRSEVSSVSNVWVILYLLLSSFASWIQNSFCLWSTVLFQKNGYQIIYDSPMITIFVHDLYKFSNKHIYVYYRGLSMNDFNSPT